MELALLHPERPPPEVKARPTPRSASTSSAASAPSPIQDQASAVPAPQATASAQPAQLSPDSAPAGGQASAGASGGTGFNLTCLGNQKRLTADERRKCDDKQWAGIGRHDPSDSGQVPPPLIDPNKAAYYDAVVAARNSPGHAPGFGCGMPINWGEGGNKLSRELKKKRLAKEPPHEPPHSLKFGPLPCYLTPPQGFLTPEADVPPMDTFQNGHAPSPPDYIQPIYRDPFARPGPGG
jgi:hypothetical protein